MTARTSSKPSRARSSSSTSFRQTAKEREGRAEAAPVVVDFQNPAPVSSSPAAQSLPKFEYEDWTTFRTIEGLSQNAGEAKDKLTRLVLKEITDNALDTNPAIR